MAIGGTAGGAVASVGCRLINGRFDMSATILMNPKEHEKEVHEALFKMRRGETVNIPLDGDMLKLLMDTHKA